MIEPYFISFKEKVDLPKKSPIYKLDREGILLYKIPYSQNFDYYPVSIAQYALGSFEMFHKTGDEIYKENFLKNAKWLLHNTIEFKDTAVWHHNYTLPYGYNFKIPWVHGMAQSLAASVFIRAHNITQEEIYLSTAKKAIMIFYTDIQDGGARYIDEKGDWWYEEYCVIPPVHILNGFIYVLFGLYEVGKYLNCNKSKILFEKGINTLKENIKEYDIGFWSLYDLLHRYPATPSYHSLHIKQLEELYKISGKTIFGEYSKKWEKYQEKTFNKIRAKIVRSFVHIKKHSLTELIKKSFAIQKYYS